MSKLRDFLLTITLFLFLFTHLTFAQSDLRPAEIEDYFNLKSVGSPAVSPDGEWIAYTVSATDYDEDTSETRIWMVSKDGSVRLPMTAEGYSAGNPQWTPDGDYLTFSASRNDSKSQVWKLDMRGGEAQQVTDIEQGINGFEWSPDGERLLLMIKDKEEDDEEENDEPKPYVIDRLQFKRDYAGYLDRKRVHVYTYTPGDSTATQLTIGDYDHSSATWSPDGSKIAFVSNRTEEPDSNDNSDIWVMDADEGEEGGLVQVTKNEGSDGSPAWSPDGREIVYTTGVEPEKIWYATTHLAITRSDGSGPEKLITQELDRNVNSPKFSENGNQIWFILEDAGERQLVAVNRNGTGFERVVKDDVSVRSFDINGSTTALLMGRFNDPHNIFALDGSNTIQLTDENREMMAELEKPEVEEIRFNSEDGTEIHGFLVKPIGYEEGTRYPTILWIHGGPVAQFDHSYRFEPHLFASKGYAVVMVNPRGSSGYGQEFSEVLFADWGNKDFEDVMAGVDHAVEMGVADPEKLGVGGWSYGGILTNYVITKTDRFEGAISGASETLYRSNYGHDHYQKYWEKELGLPWETPEKWERISPFNDVANVTTPTLWMGGAEDWNVPILGSEQMYQAMRRLGIETQLVVYPGEHHGIQKPAFQKDRFERYLGWFDQYVKGDVE